MDARLANFGPAPGRQVPARVYNGGAAITVHFLYWEDCPSHEEAYERLTAVRAEEGVRAAIRRVQVFTDRQAAELRFPGSPTIRIEGRDLQPEVAAAGPPA